MKTTNKTKQPKKRSSKALKVQPVACPPPLIQSVLLFNSVYVSGLFVARRMGLKLECFSLLLRFMYESGVTGKGLSISGLCSSWGLSGGRSFQSVFVRISHLLRLGLLDQVGTANNNGKLYAPSVLAYELVTKYMNEYNVSRSVAAENNKTTT